MGRFQRLSAVTEMVDKEICFTENMVEMSGIKSAKKGGMKGRNRMKINVRWQSYVSCLRNGTKWVDMDTNEREH